MSYAFKTINSARIGKRGKNGRREWDRTTDHYHVKVVLYH